MVSRRTALLFVMTILVQGEDATAFTTPLASSPQLRTSALQPLYAAATKTRNNNNKSRLNHVNNNNNVRLSRDEEVQLLRQTTELKRIQALEQELALQSPSLSLPLVSIRAEAAGYGDDLDGYEAALDAGQTAREVLVTRTMGLVHYAVTDILKSRSKQTLGTLSREDLVQEGAIGLARAVDKYNIGIGGKFSSYAIYWIRASILRCIAEKGEVVRVPEHVSAAVRKMTAAANRLGMNGSSGSAEHNLSFSSSNNNPLWQEARAAKALAEEAGLTDRQLQEAIKVKSRRTAGSISFEDWMQRGQDLHSDVSSLSSSSLSGSSGTDDHDESTVDSQKLRFQLSKFLRPKEMKALSLRYGLVEEDEPKEEEASIALLPNNSYQAQAEALVFGDESKANRRKKSGEMPFAEVGKQMSVSAEYGRRLVHTALAKLQKAAQEGQLEPALLF